MPTKSSLWETRLLRCREQFLDLSGRDFAGDLALIHSSRGTPTELIGFVRSAYGDWLGHDDPPESHSFDELPLQRPRNIDRMFHLTIAPQQAFSVVSLCSANSERSEGDRRAWDTFWRIARDASDVLTSMPDEPRQRFVGSAANNQPKDAWLMAIRHITWVCRDPPFETTKLTMPPPCSWSEDVVGDPIPFNLESWTAARQRWMQRSGGSLDPREWPARLPIAYYSIWQHAPSKCVDVIDWYSNNGITTENRPGPGGGKRPHPADQDRWEFAKPHREKGVKWKDIAKMWRDEKGEPVDDKSFEISAGRARKIDGVE